MKFLSALGVTTLVSIQTAFADTAAAGGAAAGSGGGLMSMLPMLVILMGLMYFVMIRPQTKRAKEHKNLLSNLQKGDEVMTIGGIGGTIEKLTDDFVVLNIANGVNINMQKSAISTVLPKGSLNKVAE